MGNHEHEVAGTSYHVTSYSEPVSDDKSGNADNISTSDDEAGNDEAGNADSVSTSDDSDSDSNFIPKHYFSKDKMPHDLREALRVS